MESTTYKPSGYGTMQIGEAERPFHVGTQQGEVFAQLPNRVRPDGRPMSLAAYGELFNPQNLSEHTLSGGDVRDFLYSALASGCEVDGLPVDFTPTQVGYWIDDADAMEVSKPFKEMGAQIMKRYHRQLERLKNEEAPTTTTTKTGPKKPKKTAATP
jgi:hypothetical protein